MRFFSDGKLKTWNQERCVICKRFLGKRQRKFCKKHAIEEKYKQRNNRNKEYRKTHKELYLWLDHCFFERHRNRVLARKRKRYQENKRSKDID